jgi:zinc/manganese transport system substrate-binding protein
MRIVLICAAAGLLAACGGAGPAHGRLRVVAAENAYGDIARQLGGDRVQVVSILSAPDADPHLFQPGTRTGLAVARADVVIANGLGYDAFVDRLVSAAPSSRRAEVVAADVLGIHGGSANPHLWYDVRALPLVARAIARAFEQADRAHARAYRTRLARFDASLGPLRRVVAAVRRAHAGALVASTEPVPGYLLAAMGLRDAAPETFSRAIEDGTEPPPAAVADMLALLQDRRVRVLLYNEQAVSPITARVRSAARTAGVPVVGVTETLPPGLTFQQWQLAQARSLREALR